MIRAAAHWLVGGLLLIAVGVVLATSALPAELDPSQQYRDPLRSEWFRSLKQPENGASCCDISDCKRTDADQLPDGSWTATVNNVEDTPIPDAAILYDKTSIDGDAYVCASQFSGYIYCFVRPTPGF